MPLPTLQTLKIAQPQPATMKLQAMKMGAELGRLGEMQKRTEIYQSQHDLAKQQFELNRMKARLSTIRQFIPQVTQDNYDDFIKWGSKLGIPEELYPSVEEVKALSPEKFESEKTKFAMDVDDFLKKDLETIKHEHAMELQTQKDAAAMARTMVTAGAEDKNLTIMQLTKKALHGDKESQQILAAMQKGKEDVAKAGAKGKVEGLFENIDIEGTAQAIIEGRETIENVKNTFGVPIQESIRKAVLAKNPSFNFLIPRAAVKSLTGSLAFQEKQRGAMGSFITNLNEQVAKIEKIGTDIVSRIGVRALDLPKREILTRFIGSGHEKVLEAYLIEISNEVGKLSTSSQASIRELSTEAQQRWSSIHDPNLSMNELLKVLQATRELANIRKRSVDKEIDVTNERLRNIGGGSFVKGEPEKTIIESRKAPDGRTIHKYSDGTFGYE